MAEANGDFSTTIGPDAVFKGEILFEKGLRVLGAVEGSIKTKGQLHVAEGARVQANVDAGSIEVDGEVKGNLVAANRIQLNSSSKLEGDLRTARLEVADGAVFVGNCRVGPQSQEKAHPVASAKVADVEKPAEADKPTVSGKKAASAVGPVAGAKK